MAVYKRTYHAYHGPVSSRRWRFLVVSRYCVSALFQSRIFIASLAFCLLPFVIFVGLIYVINSPVAQAALQIHGAAPFAIDAAFFMKFLQSMGWLGLFLCAYGTPGLVSMDLANNALPLYLSRPLSRAEYVLGKAAVVLGMLSVVTWIPGVLLYLVQAAMAGNGWGWNNLPILGAIMAGSLLWISFLALVALAISAYVRWKVIAIASIVAFMFVPAAFGAALGAILRTRWGLLLNIPYLNSLIWSHLFGVLTPFERMGTVPLTTAWMVFLFISAGALFVLHERIRAREVVRG